MKKLVVFIAVLLSTAIAVGVLWAQRSVSSCGARSERAYATIKTVAKTDLPRGLDAFMTRQCGPNGIYTGTWLSVWVSTTSVRAMDLNDDGISEYQCPCYMAAHGPSRDLLVGNVGRKWRVLSDVAEPFRILDSMSGGYHDLCQDNQIAHFTNGEYVWGRIPESTPGMQAQPPSPGSSTQPFVVDVGGGHISVPPCREPQETKKLAIGTHLRLFKHGEQIGETSVVAIKLITEQWRRDNMSICDCQNDDIEFTPVSLANGRYLGFLDGSPVKPVQIRIPPTKLREIEKKMKKAVVRHPEFRRRMKEKTRLFYEYNGKYFAACYFEYNVDIDTRRGVFFLVECGQTPRVIYAQASGPLSCEDWELEEIVVIDSDGDGRLELAVEFGNACEYIVKLLPPEGPPAGTPLFPTN